MAKKLRTKKQYPEDFRTIYGFSTLGWVNAFGLYLVALLMQYLTDFSGIDEILGKVGYAASFGTALLLVARIVDIVDDPLQAWLMDNWKESPFGKYRKFGILGISLLTVTGIFMFNIPVAVKGNVVALTIWLGAAYLIYEVGQAYYVTTPLLQKITYNARIRTKISQFIRIFLIVAIIPSVFFVPIVTVVGERIGDMGRAFSLTAAVLALFMGVVSLIGILCVKEPYRPEESAEKVKTEKKEMRINFSDIVKMFRGNKPLLIHAVAIFTCNLVAALLNVIAIYFIKWYYCADVSTGVVDLTKYAGVYSIFAALALLPNIITPFFAGKLIKKAKSYANATRICMIFATGAAALIAVTFFTGILKLSPFIFIALNFTMTIPLGLAVIPQTLLWIECADYAEYKSGKNMTALVNSAAAVINKAQNALGGVIVGGILIVAGYSVNATTGDYAGDLATLPNMIFSVGLATTLIPVIVLAISWGLYKFFYPITPEKAEEMRKALEEKRAIMEENASAHIAE